MTFFFGGDARAATTFTVNSTTDAVDNNIGNGVCETATPSQCTLRAAVQEANALAGTDTILIPAGTFSLTIAGISENAAATGDLDITSNINFSKTGAGTVTINSAFTNERLFDAPSGTPTVNMSGITLSNPSSNQQGSCFRILSGVINLNTMNLDTCVGGQGGAILQFISGELHVVDSTFTSNTTTDDGAAIHMSGGVATISGSTFTNNTATNAGGAIITDSDMTITNSTFSGNTSKHGGAIYQALGTMTISGSNFFNNSAVGVSAGGGGIDQENGDLSITTTTFDGNTAGSIGGGVFSNSGGLFEINRSTFSNNTGTFGGGGIYINEPTGPNTITNTTVSGNTASEGGGIAIDNHSSGITFLNDTIADNSSDTNAGAGFFVNHATLFFKNSILSNSDDGTNCSFSDVPTSSGHNISSDTSCSAFLTAAGDQNSTDPLLGLLADNGGPTFTQAITSSSPAFNQATNSGCPSIDQRGISRPQGSTCDIGAFELRLPGGVLVPGLPNTGIGPVYKGLLPWGILVPAWIIDTSISFYLDRKKQAV